MKGEPICEIEVSRVVDETPEARPFVLGLPDSLAETFRCRAGQFLTFELDFAGHRVRRCCSTSSAPGIDPQIKFTVKRRGPRPWSARPAVPKGSTPISAAPRPLWT